MSCWGEPLLHRPCCFATTKGREKSGFLQHVQLRVKTLLDFCCWRLVSASNVLWGNGFCMTFLFLWHFGIAVWAFRRQVISKLPQQTVFLAANTEHLSGAGTSPRQQDLEQGSQPQSNNTRYESTRPCVLYLVEKKPVQRSWQLYETKLFHSEGQACMAQLHGSQLYSHKHKARPASIKTKRRWCYDSLRQNFNPRLNVYIRYMCWRERLA